MEKANPELTNYSQLPNKQKGKGVGGRKKQGVEKFLKNLIVD